MSSTIFTLKRVLLLILAFWFSVAFLTNTFDLLRAACILPPVWKFASGNFDLLMQITLVYNTPVWLCVIFFVIVLIWLGFISVLFFKAFLSFKSVRKKESSAINAAFFCSISLAGALVIIDELFLNYGMEGMHFTLFIANLISLIVIKLLPDKEPQKKA